MSAPEIHQVRELFDSLAQGSHPNCGVFCSTCGGYSRRIPPLLRPQDRALIRQALQDSSLREIKLLGQWLSLIAVLEKPALRNWIKQKISQLSGSGLDDIDEFLIEARRWSSGPALLPYEDMRSLALRYLDEAVRSDHASLIETLLLCLKPEDTPSSLVDAAINIAGQDQQMARVLYNRLREYDPRVRYLIPSYIQLTPVLTGRPHRNNRGKPSIWFQE